MNEMIQIIRAPPPTPPPRPTGASRGAGLVRGLLAGAHVALALTPHRPFEKPPIEKPEIAIRVAGRGRHGTREDSLSRADCVFHGLATHQGPRIFSTCYR